MAELSAPDCGAESIEANVRQYSQGMDTAYLPLSYNLTVNSRTARFRLKRNRLFVALIVIIIIKKCRWLV